MTRKRAVQGFMPTPPPNVTHNDLKAYVTYEKSKPVARIRKSDRLKSEEDRLRAHVAKLRPDKPLTGPLRETVKLMWPCEGKHIQGEPKATKPDCDNVVKTLNDLLEACRVIENDARVVDMRVMKAYADPAGIWVRIEELNREDQA